MIAVTRVELRFGMKEVGWWLGMPRPKAPPFAAGACGTAAALSFHEGVPLLRLKGTPGERGHGYGKLLAPQIAFLMEHYLGTLLGHRSSREGALAFARDCEPHIPPAFREELRAASESAGMAWEDALICATFLDFYKTCACSTICAWGPRTPGGEALFGRNLDFPSLGVMKDMSLVVVTHAEGSRTFASITWPGMLGVLSGMNEDGLALALMEVRGGAANRPGIPYTMLYRRMLEDAATVGAVEGLLRAAPVTTANNLMVADTSPDAALFEFDPSGVDVRRNQDGVLFSTNHFWSPSRRNNVLAPPYLGSRMRKRAIERVVEERDRGFGGRFDEGTIIKAVQSAGMRRVNIQAMLFLPNRREVRVSLGRIPASPGPYVRLPREVLFPA